MLVFALWPGSYPGKRATQATSFCLPLLGLQTHIPATENSWLRDSVCLAIYLWIARSCCNIMHRIGLWGHQASIWSVPRPLSTGLSYLLAVRSLCAFVSCTIAGILCTRSHNTCYNRYIDISLHNFHTPNDYIHNHSIAWRLDAISCTSCPGAISCTMS